MKLVCLLSGGIDSPVAAYLMLRKGAEIVALYANNGDSLETKGVSKVKRLVRLLEEVSKKKIKLYVLPHAPAQQEFIAACTPRYQCLFCKRMIFRMGEKIAKLEGAKALLTGDSLGQVASQTLTNMATESSAVALPILRPLIGFDKVEIIKIAKEIGTYDISIEEAKEPCPFVPKKPATAARLKSLGEEEAKLNAEALLDKAVEGRVLVK